MKKIIAIAALGLLAGGCTTVGIRGGADASSSGTSAVKMDVQRLEERVSGLELSVETLRVSTAAGGSAIGGKPSQDRELADLKSRMDALERGLIAINSARQKDQEEMINVLSKKMAELLNAPSSGKSVRSGTDPRPREHIVKAGETLSSIAALHGVSVTELAAANAIKNFNSVRVGQKLTIPGRE